MRALVVLRVRSAGEPGLRRSKQTAGGTTKLICDDQDALIEMDANGTAQADYTQTPGTYGALVSQRHAGATSHYHFSALGSTTELTDAGEAVTDTWRYLAFGETTARTGSTANPFDFVGELGYCGEAGLGLHPASG